MGLMLGLAPFLFENRFHRKLCLARRSEPPFFPGKHILEAEQELRFFLDCLALLPYSEKLRVFEFDDSYIFQPLSAIRSEDKDKDSS